MHCTDKYSQLSSIIWSVWPNGWVFVYELSGCGFESRCSHLNSSHLCNRLVTSHIGSPWVCYKSKDQITIDFSNIIIGDNSKSSGTVNHCGDMISEWFLLWVCMFRFCYNYNLSRLWVQIYPQFTGIEDVRWFANKYRFIE